MTVIGPFRPQPLHGQATELAPTSRAWHAAVARERSLTEILSLTDAWKFILESLGLLALIWIAQIWLGNPPAAGGMPHPFWFPVLLISGQYGIMGGLFATLAATAMFFLGGLLPQTASQDFYDYAAIVAAQPCAWFGTALLLGGLRTLHMHHQADLQDRFNQTGLIAEGLADGLEQAVSEIERLERRIATDCGTLAAVLHSLAKLEVGDRRSLVGGVADVIRFGTGATSFAVYLKGPQGLEPCVGIVDGASVAPAAIPPLPAALRDAVLRPARPYQDGSRDTDGTTPATDSSAVARMPLWAPIRLEDGGGDTAPAGVVVCTRLHPSQDPAIASRRLAEICRVLAVLLTACPAPIVQAS